MRKTIITLIMLVAAIPMALANGVQIGDLYYILDPVSKTAQVTYDLTSKPDWQNPAYENFNSKSLQIPATVQDGSDTYKVTSIGDNAFLNCSGLNKVTFSEGLTSIGDNSFSDCTRLTEVSFPQSLTSIGDGAFNNCSLLPNISLPKGLTSIGYGAFNSCSSLTEVIIPDGITSIEGSLFSYCSSLMEVTFPKGLISIGGSAFEYCESLTEVTFPESLTSIGQSAFMRCRALKEVILPKGLTRIDTYTFDGCIRMTKLILPDGIKEIASNAFSGCSSLTKVNFPEGLTSIGSEAFYYCVGLEEVAFPEGLTSIGDMAFYNCVGLKEITLPASITKIGYWAFNGSESSSLKPFISPIFCYIKTPIGTVYDEIFNFQDSSTGKKAIVYVPASSYEAYLNSPAWNEGVLRVLPEDINGSFDIDDFEINANQTLAVPVNLNVDLYNYSYTGLQFDIEMPDNITIESTALSSELQEKGFTLSSQDKGNNLTRFIIYPTTDLSGLTTTGTVLTLTLKAASGISAGNAQIKFTNAMITTPDAEDIYLSDSTTEVTVNSTITKITITPAVKNIELNRSCNFVAVIEPADAKNTDLIWSVSEPDKVETTFSGLKATVYGNKLGTVTITAISPYDPSIKGEAILNIVGRITIEGEKHAIKETETLTLTSKFLPEGSDSPAIVWSSSDPATATVNANTGLVTGIKAGEATITASARDYEGISCVYQITVEPRILGDANDNGYVNVSDVVAIANYVVEYTVPRFCFVNADADENKEVTANDITTTVNIILDDDDYSVGPRSVKAYALASVDFLNASNFMAAAGRELNIGVNLDNSIDYVALQASLVVPQGMKVTGVKAGPRAANHSLMFNIKEDNTVKIVLFTLNNTPFTDTAEPLFTIVAEASEECGNIEIVNILASDKDNNEYTLGFTGGLNENFTTAIGGVEAAEGDVRYFTTDGMEITNPAAGQLVIRVSGGKVEKVIVK